MNDSDKQIDYEARVKKVYPNAVCFRDYMVNASAGTSTPYYHIAHDDFDPIELTELFDTPQEAWQAAYENIKSKQHDRVK